MKKVYLLALTSFPDIGGVQTSILSCAQKLVERGFDVEVISGCFHEAEQKKFQYKGVIFNKFYVKPSRLPLYNEVKIISAFTSFVNKNNFNFNDSVIFSRSVLFSYGCIRLKVKDVITLLPTITSLDFSGRSHFKKNVKDVISSIFFKLNKCFYQYIESVVIRNSDIVVFSSLMKESIENKNTGKKVSVVLPGVDDEYFIKNNSDNKNGKVLFVGRIANNKNIYHLVDIIEKTPDEIFFTIAGDGPDEKKLKLYIEKKKLSKRVSFVGKKNQEELIELYKQHSLTILPSKIETFGLTIIESMACGTPVIAYNPDGNIVKTASNEIIIDGHNGFLVKNYNDKEMASRIYQSLNYIKLNEDLFKNNCINYVNEKYNWNNIVNHLVLKAQNDREN